MKDALAMTAGIADRDVPENRIGFAGRVQCLVSGGKQRFGHMKALFAQRHQATLLSRHEIQAHLCFRRVSEFCW